jgi:hypothetical protein
MDAEADPLTGVKFARIDTDPGLLPAIAARLLAEGVRFPSAGDAVPWLVAAEPVVLDETMHSRLRAIGDAVFRLTDALQALHRGGDLDVVETLDGLTPKWLCGLDPYRPVEMFRLDVLVEDGMPRVIEVEEIFGNAGNVVAMAAAYDLPAPRIVDFLAGRGVRHVVVCDDYPEYVSAVSIVARKLAQTLGVPVRTKSGRK